MYLPPWAFSPEPCSTFDFDGVIFFGPDSCGVRPGPNDLIVTGRSYEEARETEEWCKRFGIKNRIIFSQIPFDLKTREISGYHKAITLRGLMKYRTIERHYEDDPIQKAIIEAMVPEVPIVHFVHDLTVK